MPLFDAYVMVDWSGRNGRCGGRQDCGCRENGHVLAGPRWEVYGHWEDEWNSDPTKIRTDVSYLLVAERSGPDEPGAPPDRGGV